MVTSQIQLTYIRPLKDPALVTPADYPKSSHTASQHIAPLSLIYLIWGFVLLKK